MAIRTQRVAARGRRYDLSLQNQSKVNQDDDDDDEAFLKASQDLEDAKFIALREQAASEFRIQMHQKWGDVTESFVAFECRGWPLATLHAADDGRNWNEHWRESKIQQGGPTR